MPEMRFEQSQKQTQKLIMSPQMQQAIHLLQLPLMELNAMIEQEMVANPVLEEESTQAEQTPESSEEEIPSPETETDSELDFEKEFDVLSRLDDDWREYYQQAGVYQKSSEEDEQRRQYYESSITPNETLEDHLLKQLYITTSNPHQKEIGETIIGNLDENGYLYVSLESICQSIHCSQKEFETILTTIQSFHPVGVGARSLSECLTLQLKRIGKKESLETIIVKDHLDKLGGKNYAYLAGDLSVHISEIKKAAEIISTLEPRPGRIFDQEEPVYILPDIIVEKIGDEYVITMNNEKTPRLRISSLYKNLMKEKGTDPTTKEYIKEKVQAGKWLVRNIQQRQETIFTIATELVNRQKAFLEHGISRLKPLTMLEVAQAIGIHESTVSRAIANKYMETPQGLYEMRFFFTTGLATQSGGSISTTNVKEIIQNLIKKENPHKPLSDQKIIELLSEQGIDIARRTVSKYRKELHILPTNLRKKI